MTDGIVFHPRACHTQPLREARSLEPGVSPSLLGATYSPLRSQADPELATRAFARVAERQGARILTGHDVTAIGRRGGKSATEPEEAEVGGAWPRQRAVQ